jgi:hypothetical protein
LKPLLNKKFNHLMEKERKKKNEWVGISQS